MRALVLFAGLLVAPALASAQAPVPRTPAGVPSIMTGGEASRGSPRVAPERPARRDAARRASRRGSGSLVIPPTGSAAGEGQVGSINRSLDLQQQRLGIQQQNQFETNQLRQEIQRDRLFPSGGGSLGCPAGAIGC